MTQNDTSRWRVDANGNRIDQNSGHEQSINIRVAGTLSAGTDSGDFHVFAPGSFTIDLVLLSVLTAPTGAALIVDVNVGGSSIFATADRPQIAISGTTGQSSAVLVGSRNIDRSSVITIDIDQIGSTVAGADLMCQIIGWVPDRS